MSTLPSKSVFWALTQDPKDQYLKTMIKLNLIGEQAQYSNLATKIKFQILSGQNSTLSLIEADPHLNATITTANTYFDPLFQQTSAVNVVAENNYTFTLNNHKRALFKTLDLLRCTTTITEKPPYTSGNITFTQDSAANQWAFSLRGRW